MPMGEMKVAYCSNPRYVEHLTGPAHPERPDRIRAIARAVRAAGLIGTDDPFPDFKIEFGPIAPAKRMLIEISQSKPADLETVRLVHSDDYIRRIEKICT